MANGQDGASGAQAQASIRTGLRNRLLWILGPAIVLIAGGWMYLTAGRFVSTDNAYVQANRVTIAPQVGGRVTEVLVHENQAVKQGEVLFRMDTEPFRIALARAQAQMEGIRSLLDAARAGFDSATANVRSAQEALRVNEAQFKRMQELRLKGVVSQKEVDDAANDLADARGKHDADVAGVARARSLLGGLPETPDEELSGYKLARAQLAAAQLDLDHATVRAPIDGAIGKQGLQPGDFLAPGQAAMPLVATRGLWIDANFKETDLTHVRAGQPVEIRIDTYPGRVWQGRVASISPASGAEFSILPAQNATGNWVKIVQRISVRIRIDDERAGPTLRAGMSARVRIDTGKGNSLLGKLRNAFATPESRVVEVSR